MADYGHKYADKKLSEVDRQLRRVYKQAKDEMNKKLADFNSKFRKLDKEKRSQLREGKITQKEYKDWLSGRVFIRQNWQNKIEQVTKILYDHNNQAMKLINEGRLSTFAENYNFQAFIAEKRMIGLFSIYNTEAVARLMLEKPDLLPKWEIHKKKDYKWNARRVNSVVTQAIIQGKSIDEITGELCDKLSSTNDSKMRMFARTAITGAENAGRQQQMNDAAKLGIEVHKQWEAAHDSRTRPSHRAIDGEEVPYNEDFSNGLEFPGDPAGAPEEVYNCRCTMKTIYPEYEDREAAQKRYDDMEIDGESYTDWKHFESYEAWKESKKKK